MKQNVYIVFRIISVVSSFLYFFSFLWFYDSYKTESALSIIFLASTGFAFLSLALIRDSWLTSKIVRLVGLFIGVAGLLNNVHIIVKYKDYFNEVKLSFFAILLLMLLRFINPKIIKDDEKGNKPA